MDFHGVDGVFQVVSLRVLLDCFVLRALLGRRRKFYPPADLYPQAGLELDWDAGCLSTSRSYRVWTCLMH